jgi:glycosyltransferase involved in cell wall biosynthesis
MQFANVVDKHLNMPAAKSDLAVIIGPPNYRKKQEVEIFLNSSRFRTMLVLSAFTETWRIRGANYVHAGLEKVLPDFLTSFLMRKPYSPVSFVKLANLRRLENVSVFNCIELYSFISRQCAEFAEKHGKKLVISVFETIPSPVLHAFPPFAINVKKVLKQADLFIAYTKRSVEYLRQLLVLDDRIEQIYPGVNLQKFRPSNDKNHDRVRILFVGGFAGEKGLVFLIKAFKKLCIEGFSVELWLCTKPRNTTEEALIERYSHKYSIKALGYVSHDKMPNIYRQCDIFCLPSFDKKRLGFRVWEEQFGFALIEAMASGLPVVATTCGATREVIGSKNLLVPQKSEEGLYSALRSLIEDENHRLNLGKANRKRAERLFDLEKQRIMADEAISRLL